MKASKKRIVALGLLLATVGGALAFWRYLKSPQIEVAEPPVPTANAKAALSSIQLAALQESETITLYSLYFHDFPDLVTARQYIARVHPQVPPVTEFLHGYAVLGKTKLHGSRRNAGLKAFYRGVSEGHWIASCFGPRHALRVERAGKIIDFVICFRCHQFIVNPKLRYEDNKPIGISDSPKPVFDALLKEAGVPLSPM